MTGAPAEDLREVLVGVAWRLWWGRLVQRALVIVACAAGATGALLLARRIFPAFEDVRLAAALVAAASVAALLPALRPVALARVAAILDRACGLDERLSTALGCLSRDGAMARLVVRDAALLARSLDVGRLPRPSLVGPGWFAAGLLLCVALLWLEPGAPASRALTAVAGAPRAPGADSGRTIAAAPPRAERAAGPAPASGPRREGRGLLSALGLETPPAPVTPGSALPAAARRGNADDRPPAASPLLPARAPGAGAMGEASAAGDAPASPSTGGAGPSRAADGDGSAPGTAPGHAGVAMGVAAAAGGGAAAEPGRRAPADEEARARPIPSGAEAGAALGGEPVPAALRHYIVRYFEILRATHAGR